MLGAFTLGSIASFFLMRHTIGSHRWRDGYLYGFNHAWDEKTKVEEAVHRDRMKKLRKTGAKLIVVKEEKS